VFESLVRDLEILVQCGLVHGDLSAYNVLFLDAAPRVIDLPQAVRIEDAQDAWALFHRDVDNLSRYFARHGLAVDPIVLAIGIWQRR
jgi:RIO kinase 1